MSDQYFKDKAEEIFNQIKINEGWGADSTFNLEDPTCKLLYISLKETARDQRYACIDVIGIECNIDQREQNRLEMLIQNASIESKK